MSRDWNDGPAPRRALSQVVPPFGRDHLGGASAPGCAPSPRQPRCETDATIPPCRRTATSSSMDFSKRHTSRTQTSPGGIPSSGLRRLRYTSAITVGRMFSGPTATEPVNAGNGPPRKTCIRARTGRGPWAGSGREITTTSIRAINRRIQSRRNRVHAISTVVFRCTTMSQ